MNGVVNTIKAGQSVPMKFEVFVNNVEMTDPTIGGTTIKSFTQQRISCDTFVGDPVDAVEQTNTGGTSLRYDTTSGQFVANWKTPGGPKDSCWKAQVTAMDGTSALEAFFRLK